MLIMSSVLKWIHYWESDNLCFKNSVDKTTGPVNVGGHFNAQSAQSIATPMVSSTKFKTLFCL